ncbi:unnamed protein product [Blepharisma stoltei]|uniref:Uncharacterized protein n=1 Tax=Blepharisma stoltei TaxID=1481888 RepID=A0AAU9JX42_9CILI|nr:unnamed protein product [Blepharisma stoltei]
MSIQAVENRQQNDGNSRINVHKIMTDERTRGRYENYFQIEYLRKDMGEKGVQDLHAKLVMAIRSSAISAIGGGRVQNENKSRKMSDNTRSWLKESKSLMGAARACIRRGDMDGYLEYYRNHKIAHNKFCGITGQGEKADLTRGDCRKINIEHKWYLKTYEKAQS